jgi:hypothetical protein
MPALNDDQRHVVFLGAGASRAMGYALTSEILPSITRRLSAGFGDERLDNDDARNTLEHCLKAALPALDSQSDHLPLVTHVLSLLDYCILNDETLVPRLDLREARALLEWSIINVLTAPIHAATVNPKAFARWLLSQSAAVISTNYDVGVDLPLLREGLNDFSVDYPTVDFGFTWRDLDNGDTVPPPQIARLVIYKLHGSLNWLKCGRCGYIYVNFAAPIVVLDGDDSPAATCHCGDTLKAILVAPSFVRTVRDPSVLSTWHRALERLRRATTWTFIGYSLPPEDVALRGLILRAFHGTPRKPRIHVVTRGEDGVFPYQALFRDFRVTLGGLEELLRST